jgi:hypothetical protein
MGSVTGNQSPWGDGSVYRRGKTGPWMAPTVNRRRAAAPVSPSDGPGGRVSDTRRGALAALEDLKAEQRDGLQLAKQSFGDYT